MTEEEIKKYIDQLNNESHNESIFIRPISSLVDIAKVWPKQPELCESMNIDIPSYDFFFIKNKSSKYVGAVLDMNRDLHWFILKKHRKNGYLTNALKESILPYIFYKDREEQRITIDKNIGKENYLDSKKVAIKLGFK
jgi:hypothetical protein